MKRDKVDDAFDVGAWVGRRQAVSVMAGRCSAADAECLRELRETKRYRSVGLTWDEFCKQRLGISRAAADKVIRQFEQLGPTYFLLAAVTRITPEEFRLIAPSVNEDHVSYGGEKIPITEQNGPRLTRAIEDLRRLAPPPESTPPDPAAEAEQSFARADKAMSTAVAEYKRLGLMNLDAAGRRRLQMAICSGLGKLDRLALPRRI